MLQFFVAFLFPISAMAIYVGAPIPGATTYDLKCAASPHDAYDPSAKISSRSKLHAGECVDSTVFRPVRFLHFDDINDQPTNLRIANLYVDGQFWVGVIPGNSWVDKILFQIEEFSTGTAWMDKIITPAHTMMRVVLKDSARIDLYDPMNPDGPVVKQASVKNLNISIDAALAPHSEYNFIQEMDPVFPIVTEFIAARDIVKMHFGTTGKEFRPIEQFELKMSQAEMDAVLYAALSYGERLQLNYYYNTLNFNCATEEFTNIDTAIKDRNLKVKKFHVAYSPDPVRGPALKALKARGLLDPTHPYPNLTEETQDGQVVLP